MQIKEKTKMRKSVWIILGFMVIMNGLLIYFREDISLSPYVDSLFYGVIALNAIFLVGIVLLLLNPSRKGLWIAIKESLEEMPFIDLKYHDSGLDKRLKQDELDMVDDEDTNAPVLEKPKKVIKVDPILNSQIEPSIYLDQISNYMTDSGLSVDKTTLRETFASMASSKVALFRSEHLNVLNRYIELFTHFIGAQLLPIKVEPTITKFEELLSTKYMFQTAIKHATDNPNKLYFVVLNLKKLTDVNQYLDKLLAYAYNPKIGLEIVFPNKEFLSLPANVWFFITDTESKKVESSLSLYHSASLLNVNAKPVTPLEEVSDNAIKFTYENFTNLLSEGLNKAFLEEAYFKKIDAVESFVKKQADYPFDNRLSRQIERYTSAFILFGGDGMTSIDSVLYSKVLPILEQLTFKPLLEEEEDIISVFEKSFGLDNLYKTKGLLKNIQESQIKP